MSIDLAQAPAPPVVSREEWNAARAALMVDEKANTRQKDALSARRRHLPMVEIATGYRFTGPNGECALADLFEGRTQLIVQHFMFHPDWDRGCPSCTFSVNNIGTVEPLHRRDITFALVSRAPLPILEAYRGEMGWTFPWYSSFGTSFNRDFGVTVEEDMEIPGMSVFLRRGDTIYQTYSTGGRGVEPLLPVLGFLDMTPYGRQEDWEDSPAGWPQRPTYG